MTDSDIHTIAAKHSIKGDTIEFVRELFRVEFGKKPAELSSDDAFQSWVNSEVARIQQCMNGGNYGQT